MPGSSTKSPETVLKNFEKSSLRPKAMEPIDRLVFAVLAENRDPIKVEDAIARVKKKFINFNECRVSRWVEIARALDPLENSDQGAMRMRDMLNRLFDMRGSLSLDFLTTVKLSEARRMLKNLDPAMSRDVLSMVIYEFMPTMTVPVTPEGLKVARKHGLISKTGTKAQLQKVLEEAEPQTAAKLLHYIEIEAESGTKTTTKEK